jgi:predicted permease
MGITDLWLRIRAIALNRTVERELHEELVFHVEMQTRRHVAAGLDVDEARRLARAQFGSTALVEDHVRDARGIRFVETIAQDTRYGLRLMRRNPAFTTAAVLALAIGIGATATVFALVNAVELKPLPVRAPEELVFLDKPSFSYPIFRELHDRGRMFSGLFAWQVRASSVRWSDETESIPTLVVTGEFYSTLDVRSAVGRLISQEDDRDGAPHSVAVLSHTAWIRHYGGDPVAVGRSIAIDGVPFTIIGVTPPGFFGVAVGAAPDVTIPVAMVPQMKADERDLLRRGTAWLHIMGRLRSGVDPREANAAFQPVWQQVLQATTPRDETPARRARFLGRQSSLQPGATGFSWVRNQFRDPLRLLFALVGLLLLVACAAVANLLLARGCARQRELAVRVAIGAGRGRLVRQLLVEGLLLSFAGSAAGFLISTWSAGLLVEWLSTPAHPVVLEVTSDARVFAFTAMLSCVVALLFTLAPALRALRTAPADAIKGGGRRVASAEWRPARLLVVSQIGFSMLLLAGAALFLRSLGAVMGVESGIDPGNVLVVSVEPPLAAERQAFYRELVRQLESIPGVTAASLSWVPPISDDLGSWTRAIGIDGAAPPDDGRETVFFNAVSPGYFEAVGTRIVVGRDFTWHDGQPAPRVVIVNEALARSAFGVEQPIGRRLTVGLNAARKDLLVVGVVRDAKYQRLQEPVRPIAYLPHEQQPEFLAGNNLVAEVRTAGAPAAAIGRVRQIVRAMNPASPVAVRTLSSRIDDSLVRERLIAAIATLLGVFALILSAAALYGLLAHMVGRRTGEIGIRLALGAPRHTIVGLVAGDAIRLAVAGTIVGISLIVASRRVAEQYLFGITALDLMSLASTSAIVLSAALLAAYLPARRAIGLNPTTALRSE